jgi:PTS system glucose-specific IIC component
MFKSAFGVLQQIGKALMLPVAVLPVAGLLLGIGASNFPFLPQAVSLVMSKGGGAIFGNLPLIFSVGVALGLAKNDGVAAIAAVVGFVVMTATLGVMAGLLGVTPATVIGMPSMETAFSAALSSVPSPPLCSIAITASNCRVISASSRVSALCRSSPVWPPLWWV